jgi:hypothetical protein
MKLRMLNRDITRYELHVGFRIAKSNLEMNGECLVFTSQRERLEFREILREETPKTMTDVKILYEMYRYRKE